MKIEPQLKWASSTPPSTGPRAMPTAAMAAQMAMARARSSASGKTVPRIDSVDGMIMAPPMPMKARVAMSTLASVANAAARRADAEHDQAELQHALAAVAVGEGAGA